jgi:hypothetical protein
MSSAGPVDHGTLQADTPKTYYETVVRTPGFGDAPERCRPMKPVGFCEHGHPVLGRSSCGVRYCPDHWRDWIEGAVISMVARLAAYREVCEDKRLSHVVASPPQDRRYSQDRLWATRSDAYDALEAAGVRGGATVTHPYRTNDRADNLYETAKEQGDLPESTGKWRFLREIADDWDDMAGYVEAEPHYHALAAAEDVDGEAAPPGWVVKRIRSFKPFYYQDTEAYRDMAATAYYVLTHTAVQKGRQSTTYFGDVHPAGFKPEEELTAAKWDRIQLEAEKAVKTERGEHEEDTGAAPEECPHDECEAEVVGLYLLPDYLADDEWVASLRARQGGRKRWMQLQGLMAWCDSRTDRPPPGALTHEGRLLEWLEDKGKVLTPAPQSVSLEDAMPPGAAWGA